MENRKKSESEMTFIEIHRRKQIVDTAIDIIARDGYQQATLASVAKEAGFSKGVIFYYFKNKDELILQINEVLLEELRTYTRQNVKGAESTEDSLKIYVKAYLDYVRQNVKKFRILAELGINLNARSTDPLFGPKDFIQCRQNLFSLLDKSGKLEKFNVRAANSLIVIIQGMLDGVGIQYVSDPEMVDLDSCQEIIFSMIEAYFQS